MSFFGLINLVFPSRIKTPAVRKRVEEEFFDLISGNILLDLGANEGRIFEVTKNQVLHYIGFEPDPDAFNKLLQKTLTVKRARVLQAAAWISDGDTFLFRHSQFAENQATTSSSLIAGKRNIDRNSGIRVRTIDFPTFLRSFNQSVIVKMDIEGSEYPILDAMFRNPDVLSRHYFFIEFHPTKLRGGRMKHLKFLANVFRLNAWHRIRIWP